MTDTAPSLPPMTKPHDQLSLDELAASYNHENTSARALLLAKLLLDEVKDREGPVRALDIGCGHGLGRDPVKTRMIAAHVDEMWGIEPDEGVTPPEGIFGHFQHALMETAELPANHFDLAYAYMVMEHVADPPAFLRAVHRALKPGGVFVFATVNGKHYFTRAAHLMHVLHVDEVMLRLLRGRQFTEGYHYRVEYKCNTRRQIERAAADAGFESPTIAYIEEMGPAPYLPGPLKIGFHVMNAKRRVIRKPESLLTLMARLRKPG